MARPTSPLRLGIVGCGNVLSAYRAAIDTLRVRGLAEPVIACGREAQRATACATLGLTRFTTHAQEVITSPDVDIVLILTSMTAHARLGIAALDAGKHVQTSVKPAKLVEKMWKFNSLKRSEKRGRVEDRLEEFLAGSSAEG